jgi:two-component system NtrC family sensor kinase
MNEKPKSQKKNPEKTKCSILNLPKDDPLEESLKHLEAIIESYLEKDPSEKGKVARALLSHIKMGVEKENRELQNAYRKLKELTDLVDKKETTQKKGYLNKELIQADKMVTLGQLAGGVAHELNNPLTGVLGNAQVLLSEIPKHNPWYEDVERIFQAAKRCKEIIANLLDFSRQQDFEFEMVDINQVIQNTLNLCGKELTLENIKVMKEFAEDLPKINLSVLQMEQVFLNLIVNARQAMPSGGTLTISTRLVEIDGVPEVEISFVDTGKGIKKEDLSKIFKPFFTTKEKGKGTGLGLSVSRSIVEKHNGTIKVESEGEGKGAKFTVILPCRKED